MTLTQFVLVTLLERAKARVLRPSWFDAPATQSVWVLYTRLCEIERTKSWFAYTVCVSATNGSLRSWASSAEKAAELNKLDALGRWQEVLTFCDVPVHLHSYIPIDQLTLDALELYTTQANDT